MKAAPGGEGGAALFQRRRGLAGSGLLLVPEDVDHVLHCLARHVGISFGMGGLSDSAWAASAAGPGCRRFGRLLLTITLAIPDDRVAAPPPPRSRESDDPKPPFAWLSPIFHLNVRPARPEALRTRERDPRTSAGRSPPRSTSAPGYPAPRPPSTKRPPSSSPIHADSEGVESRA